MRMKKTRDQLEAEFMRLCRIRGPAWVESVIRPLKLQRDWITVQDIPAHALRAIVRLFGKPRKSSPGVAAL